MFDIIFSLCVCVCVECTDSRVYTNAYTQYTIVLLYTKFKAYRTNAQLCLWFNYSKCIDHSDSRVYTNAHMHMHVHAHISTCIYMYTCMSNSVLYQLCEVLAISCGRLRTYIGPMHSMWIYKALCSHGDVNGTHINLHTRSHACL